MFRPGFCWDYSCPCIYREAGIYGEPWESALRFKETAGGLPAGKDGGNHGPAFAEA
jgi:hypothetical protein